MGNLLKKYSKCQLFYGWNNDCRQSYFPTNCSMVGVVKIQLLKRRLLLHSGSFFGFISIIIEIWK